MNTIYFIYIKWYTIPKRLFINHDSQTEWILAYDTTFNK
jgi:hypothetical protein